MQNRIKLFSLIIATVMMGFVISGCNITMNSITPAYTAVDPNSSVTITCVGSVDALLGLCFVDNCMFAVMIPNAFIEEGDWKNAISDCILTIEASGTTYTYVVNPDEDTRTSDGKQLVTFSYGGNDPYTESYSNSAEAGYVWWTGKTAGGFNAESEGTSIYISFKIKNVGSTLAKYTLRYEGGAYWHWKDMDRAWTNYGNEWADPSSTAISTVEVIIYDTTAPVITAVQSEPNSNFATITWNTLNELSTSKVYYWKDGLLTLEATGTSGTAHSVILTSLDPSTIYYYKVESADPVQNVATLEGSSFTTLATRIQTYTISGYVSAPLYTEAIMVYLSGASSACQPVYSPTFPYSFANLLAGSYTVTVEAIKDYTLQAPTIYTQVVGENISGWSFTFTKDSATPSGTEVPLELGEARNHPNPFNPNIEKTKIIFNIDEPEVKLTIYDLRGKALATKLATSTTNYYEVEWDGKSDFGGTVSNGTYLYLVTSGGKVLAKGQIAVWK